MVLAGARARPFRVKPQDHIALALRDELDFESKGRDFRAVAQVVSDFGGLSALALREHGRRHAPASRWTRHGEPAARGAFVEPDITSEAKADDPDLIGLLIHERENRSPVVRVRVLKNDDENLPSGARGQGEDGRDADATQKSSWHRQNVGLRLRGVCLLPFSSYRQACFSGVEGVGAIEGACTRVA